MWAKRVLNTGKLRWRFKDDSRAVIDAPQIYLPGVRLIHLDTSVYADAPKGCSHKERGTSSAGSKTVSSTSSNQKRVNCAGAGDKGGSKGGSRGGGGGGGGGGGRCGGSSGCCPPPPCPESLECHPARFQYSRQVELGVNCQIAAELEASYFYMSLAATFGRVDVALRGIEQFFWRAANQERNDAIRLADYQNKRGGIVSLCNISEPGEAGRTTCAKDALANSLQVQRNLTTQLLNLYQMANDCNDPVTCDFLSELFLMKQVKRLSRNGRYITQLCRVGDSGLALHDFDEWLFSSIGEVPGIGTAVKLHAQPHSNAPLHGHTHEDIHH